MDEERIIWTGRPRYKARLAFLELAGGEAGIVAMIVPAIFIILILTASSSSNNWVSLVCYIVIIGSIVIPEIHKHFRRKYTEYQLTNKHIKINDFWYGKRITHSISLNDIERFAIVNFKDDCGRIHLMVNKELNINTRNFWSGSFHPTIALEDIESTSKTYETFTQTLYDFKRNK